MTQYCYFNGQVIPVEEAKVGVNDIGLLRAYGIYDALTAYGDKLFRFQDHWNRFVDGAHRLGLNIPITEERCEKIMKELVEKNGFERSIIRVILTGGPAIHGIEFNFETPTFYILVEKWEEYPKEWYEQGGKLVTYRYKREMPEVKTINYINAVLLQGFKKEEGAAEILYVYDGEVFECSTANIFLVKDGKLIVPGEEVLGGITAKVVCELAQEKGMECEVRRVAESELQTADEIFITSSFRDIMPMTMVDDFKVGTGEVGQVTRDLMERFEALTR